jgi:hypothetical protein
MAHSVISNNRTVATKGILKRSLHEISKDKVNTQEDPCDDKNLYLEL